MSVSLDPDNPVIALCIQGMQAEGEGRPGDARDLFARAYEQRTDDFEACIAAHYLARHQATPRETLRWNKLAVDHAEAVSGGRVREFYPSLYLNLGRSYEDAGDHAQAARCYHLAGSRMADLPDDGYGNMLRRGIQQALRRVTSERSGA